MVIAEVGRGIFGTVVGASVGRNLRGLCRAGGAGGALAGGRHLRHEPDTTMSNLLLAMLHKLGIEQEFCYMISIEW